MPTEQWESFHAARRELLAAGKPSTCPVRQVADRPDIMQYVRDAGVAERTGVLLRAGGLEDQPARWLEAVQIVWTENNVIDQELVDAARKESKR